MPTVDQEKPGSTPQFHSAFDREMKSRSAARSIPEGAKTEKPVRKKLIRRDDRDYSQRLHFAVQIFFAALNAWIGVQFYLWVRWAESGGRKFEVARPAGIEGWLPIEGLMQLKYFLVTGNVPMYTRQDSFSLPRSCLFCSPSARHFAAGYVRSVPYPNICGSWAGHLLVATSSCHAGSIYRFGR